MVKKSSLSEIKMDGWSSALAGLGNSEHDRRESFTFQPNLLSKPEASVLWSNEALAGRIVETIPEEEIREGIEFNTGDELTLKEELTEWFDEKNILQQIEQARQFERAYGGSAIVLGIQDNQTLEKPVKWNAVKDLQWIKVFEPDQITPSSYSGNIETFGQPEIFSVRASVSGKNITQEVHASRIIALRGIRVTNVHYQNMAGLDPFWGVSVLSRVHEVIRDYGISWAAVSHLITDFSQPVYSIEGLAELLKKGNEEVFKRRMKAIELSRSVVRAVILDAKEGYSRQATNVSGLPELLNQFKTRLASAADMPVTLLMGQSPDGMNATGESDIKFFYNRVKNSQTKKVLPIIKQFLKVFTAIQKKPNFRVKTVFKPLFQQSDKEIADTRYTVAQTDNIYYAMGLNPSTIIKNRFGGNAYSMDMVLEPEDLEELEPNETLEEETNVESNQPSTEKTETEESNISGSTEEDPV